MDRFTRFQPSLIPIPYLFYYGYYSLWFSTRFDSLCTHTLISYSGHSFPPYSYTLLYIPNWYLLYTLYTAYTLLRILCYSYYFLIVISLKLDAPFNGLASYRVDSRLITPTVIRIKIIPSIVSLLFIRFILYYLLFLFLINIIHTTIHAIYTIFIWTEFDLP